MAWVPLQRVLLPGYLADPAAQADTVRFLMAHGANPRSKLPFDPAKNVIAFAAAIKSPMVALLDAPPPPRAAPATTLAQTSVAGETARLAGGGKLARDSAPRPLRQAARFDVKSSTGDTTAR